MQGAVVLILTKNCHPFPFIYTTSRMKTLTYLYMKIFIYLTDFYIFTYFTYPFLLKLPSLPPTSLLINHIFSWKSRLKHTGLDIICFFQDEKSSLTKHKKCYWKRFMEPVEHLRWSLFSKKVNG